MTKPLRALSMPDQAAGRLSALPAVLGWSNPDTGPESLRLYALDAGSSPRWAKPHARTAETAIRELGLGAEGTRAVVVLLPHDLSDDRLRAMTLALMLAAAGELVRTDELPAEDALPSHPDVDVVAATASQIAGHEDPVRYDVVLYHRPTRLRGHGAGDTHAAAYRAAWDDLAGLVFTPSVKL